jgi:hypothetical protein
VAAKLGDLGVQRRPAPLQLTESAGGRYEPSQRAGTTPAGGAATVDGGPVGIDCGLVDQPRDTLDATLITVPFSVQGTYLEVLRSFR